MVKVIQLFSYKAVVLLLLVLNSSCALFDKKPEAYVFYPPSPVPPRIQYLTSYSSPNDLLMEDSSLSQFLLGEEAGSASITKPYGVDIHDGIIYVVDIRGPGYAKFDLKNKKFDFIYGSFGGKMKKPINIWVDEDGTKYIADISRGRVMAYDAKDDFIRAYMETKDFKPSDVLVAKNKLFVSCMAHHQIHVFDKVNGKQLYSIGKVGSKEGELFYPANLALGPDNLLYISETGNYRIQKFTLDGKPKGSFGKVGTGFGQFSRPKGIAVDRDGRIFIVDASFENVQIMDSEGKVLLFFGEPGPERGNINLPAAIAIDYDNVAYFQKFADPKFKLEYIILIASQFGRNKINVYGFGTMEGEDYSTSSIN